MRTDLHFSLQDHLIIYLQSNDVLNKYVALYAANRIKNGDLTKALDLFVQYGAPPNPQVSILVLPCININIGTEII